MRQLSPEARVLIPNDTGFRDYGRNPYAGYDSAAQPFLYRGEMPENIEPMARVVVVRTGTDPIIVSLERVRADTYEKDGFVIRWRKGMASALDSAKISESRDVGSVRVTRNGKDTVHDVTFAFVAHAFHPSVPIVTE